MPNSTDDGSKGSKTDALPTTAISFTPSPTNTKVMRWKRWGRACKKIALFAAIFVILMFAFRGMASLVLDIKLSNAEAEFDSRFAESALGDDISKMQGLHGVPDLRTTRSERTLVPSEANSRERRSNEVVEGQLVYRVVTRDKVLLWVYGFNAQGDLVEKFKSRWSIATGKRI